MTDGTNRRVATAAMAPETRHRVACSFFVWGEKGAGKTVLIEKICGTYEPSPYRTHPRPPPRTGRRTGPTFRTVSTTVRGYVPQADALRSSPSEGAATRFEFALYEVPADSRAKMEVLSEALLETSSFRRGEDGPSPSSPPSVGGKRSAVEGLPVDAGIGGLIWVLRGNVLLSRTEVLKAHLVRRLVELARGRREGEGWPPREEDYDALAASLGELYRTTFLAYVEDSRNEMETVAALPCFVGVPLLLVLSRPHGARPPAERVSELAREIVKKATSALSRPGGAGGATRGPPRPDGVGDPEALVSKLLYRAFALSCDEDGFRRRLGVDALHGKLLRYSTAGAPPHPVAHLYYNAATFRDATTSLRRTGSRRAQPARPEPFSPALVVDSAGSRLGTGGGSLLPEAGALGYYDELSHGRSDVVEREYAYGPEGPYESVLHREEDAARAVPRSPAGSTTRRNVLLPPAVSLCVTSLGDERDDDSVEDTCVSRDRYVARLESGTAFCTDDLDRLSLRCDQTENFVLSWMVTAGLWDRALDAVHEVFVGGRAEASSTAAVEG
jgi:hypothetical protein